MSANHDHKASALSSHVMELFRAMIAAAPDELENSTDYHAQPCLVRVAYGWGQKYVDEIELHGERWLETFAQAKNIVAGKGIVALLGTRGSGKTRMAAEITRDGYFPSDRGEWTGNGIVTGKTSLYRTTIDFFHELREAAKSNTTSEKKVMDKLEKPGLLVMDDYHERGNTEWENRIFGNLIDKRYAACRPTIIIANYTVAEMAAAVGPSVADRIRENGRAFVCDWKSYREKA